MNHDTQDVCAKCRQPFNEEDTRITGSKRRYNETPFCRTCVDFCHDTDIADHWCAVDRFWVENKHIDV